MSQQQPNWWHGLADTRNVVIPTNSDDSFEFISQKTTTNNIILKKVPASSDIILTIEAPPNKSVCVRLSRTEFVAAFFIEYRKSWDYHELDQDLMAEYKADMAIKNVLVRRGKFLTILNPLENAEHDAYVTHVWLDIHITKMFKEWLGTSVLW